MYLEMKDLSKSFDGKEVVSGLNLSMEQGEILCLLGASGCGKTTTLRMAGGFLTPDQGRIYLDGEDITELPPERRPVSTVFQSYALFPHMTVLQNVMYGLKFQGMKKKEAARRAEEYLEIVGLADRASSSVQELSRGQQQRVALADKIAIMEGGRLIQMGAPRDVYQNPSSLFVMEFLGTADKAVMPDGSLLYFRPEDIRILGRKEELEAGEEAGQKTQAPASRKQLTGVISKSDYMGFYTQYFVETESGEILVREFEREYQPGEAVMLELQGGKAF